MRSVLSVVVGAVLLCAAPLGAQVRVEVGPMFGYYRPMGHFQPASVYDTGLPQTPGQLAGDAVGASARLSIGSRWGGEGDLSFVSTTIAAGPTPDGRVHTSEARVAVGTAEAQYDISPSRALRILVGAGPGLVWRGGPSYTPYGSPTSLGGAFGLTLERPIGTHLQIAAGANTVVYWLDVPMPQWLRANPGSMERGRQVDELLQLRASWRP